MNSYIQMQCPSCKQVEKFDIDIAAFMTIHADGEWKVSEPCYDGGSSCICPVCDYDGLVRDFEKEYETNEKPS